MGNCQVCNNTVSNNVHCHIEIRNVTNCNLTLTRPTYYLESGCLHEDAENGYKPPPFTIHPMQKV